MRISPVQFYRFTPFTAKKKEDFDTSLKNAVDSFLKTDSEKDKMAILTLVKPFIEQNNRGNEYYLAADAYQEAMLALLELMARLKDSKTF